MGQRLGLNLSRTAIACLLIAVAVAVPCGAWYLVGSRNAEREAHLLEKGVYHTAYKKAEKLAERLATRIEVLREVEARRPFYHYQNLFHDPKGASEGASVSLSPLAHGPADPLIEVHFQVDEEGSLTLPTLNDQFPELGLDVPYSNQCSLFRDLADVAVFCSRGLLERELTVVRPAVEGHGTPPTQDDTVRELATVEVLERRAWTQHLQANVLYADLKYRQQAGRPAQRELALANGRANGRREMVEILVGPFTWQTLPVGGEPALVALRPVETPAGVWVQGFVVAREGVRQYLEDASFAATFQPDGVVDDRQPSGQVAAAVRGTPWAIALDVSKPLADASTAAQAERDSFFRSFLLGALAAGLAALALVTLVYQTERLAHQRSQFAASAAHELRTPLAGLRLYGEMLAEGLGSPGRTREYARRLAGEAERLGRVVTNVLSFTRLERKTLSVHPVPGDLRAAVESCILRQKPALEEAGAQIELELGANLPLVSFDHDAVCHIVQNLLDNAEKYTRGVADRQIRVTVAMGGEDARAAAGAETVILTVADNGPGIPPRARARLFRPFARGLQPDAPAGLGLGLVLVRALVRAQDGDICYADAPGGGAVFTVTFRSAPSFRSAPAAAAQPTA